MSIFILFVIIIILMFGGVILFGAPYLPTLNIKVQEALDLMNLDPGQKLLELGSGDGRLLIAAAKRGIYAEGYELNPILFLYSYIKSIKYRKYIKIHLGNFWNSELPEADAVYVFLLDKYMSKLHNKIVRRKWKKPLILVSYSFQIKDIKPAKEKSGMFLYKY